MPGTRRSLLASLAAAGVAAGSAGCLQQFRDGPGRDATRSEINDGGDRSSTRPPDDDARERNATDPSWNPDGGPVETFRVGDRDAVAFPDSNQPHTVSLWNRVDRERDVAVDVTHGATDDPVLLGPVAVPAGYTVQVSLRVPTRYALDVSVDGESLGAVTVGRRWIDCNYSDTPYALGRRDVIAYPATSTTVACAAPTIASTGLDVDSRDCASDGDPTASIVYKGERVRVDGTVVASNPCHDLSIASTTYSDETKTATVVVDATHPEDPRQDCVGGIDYNATIAFDRDIPDHVDLLHRDASGDDERVATATRNGR
jgi:hypothetical protein